MRIITRTILILSMVSLLADIASEMLYPVIPVYLKEIGFSILLIGTLEGVVGFVAGISKGYFGKLSDERGERLPFVKLGYLLSNLSKPLLALFTSVAWVFGIRTIDRLGKGVRTAARDAMLSQEASQDTKGRVFGFHRSMDTAGAAIGPVLALGYLYFNPGDYKTLFYLAFIPGILAVLLIYLVKEKKQPVTNSKKGSFLSYFKYWRTASPLFKKIVPGLLLFALFNSSDIFLLLVTKEKIGAGTIDIMGASFNADSITIAAYVVYNLVFALASYPMGILADRMGFKKTILFGFVLFAVVYAGFAFNPSISIIFILFSVYGIFAAATEGVIKAWISNMAQKEHTATAIGFYTSCESICAFFASIIAGGLWEFFGSQTTFLSTAFVSIVVCFYFLLKLKTK
ncbi:MAG TPA: MFS transporter [Chitinophagaceae bacterium]|nr:MFS transporter [Chitinophagaceae bacterium]